MFRQESVGEDDKRLPLQSVANYLSRPRMSRNLFWLSDEQWARIEPHLPTDARGVERADDRRHRCCCVALKTRLALNCHAEHPPSCLELGA